MNKNNVLTQAWNNKSKKYKMPKSKQDFINSKEAAPQGLKNSSGPENVKGFKSAAQNKKIKERAKDFFENDINNYMKNKQTKSKFDVLFENIMNGMSEDEREELGVTDEIDDNDSFDEVDDVESTESDMVTVTLTQDQVACLRDILSKIDESDIDSEDSDDELDLGDDEDFDFESESEDEDNEVDDGSSFGEGIETEVVSPEKGKKYMNKASNKVGGKISVKGGKAVKGKIPAIREDPEELPESKGKTYLGKEANKVKSNLSQGNSLF